VDKQSEEYDMKAIRTKFDGKTIRVPKQMRKAPAGDVLLVIPDRAANGKEDSGWLKAQEQSFAEVWDNDEDAVYDSL
jgi:TusA-related sulfurtransferase